MAELTNLESKLGEVLGLALAAQGSGQKVSKLAREEGADDLVETLERMAQEAKETADRCERVAGSFEGKKTAILEKARETKQEATEMMSAYLGDDADALDGLEFLTMAEAGEVGHWSIVDVLSFKAGHEEVQQLVQWAKPIQERHFRQVMQGSLELAKSEDPNGAS